MVGSGKIAGTSLIALIVAACAGCGFYELFSNFRPYDDEGLFMASNHFFLAGYTPYREISWLFGPVQLAYTQLLHGGLGVPITHSAVRFVTLATWLLLCLLCAALVGKLSRSWLWGATAFVSAFLFTDSTVNEPGHPQVLVAAASVAIPLLGGTVSGRGARLPWLLVGVMAAIVFHIKINAGAYVVAAIGVLLASQWQCRPASTRLQGLVIAGSFAFPLLLMSPLLREEYCLEFALISALAMAAVAAILPRQLAPGMNAPRASADALIGFAALTAVALAYAAFIGVSPIDIAASLRSYAGDQAAFYHYFRAYTPLQLTLACSSAVIALAVCRHPEARRVQVLVPLAKTGLAGAAVYCLAIDDAAHSQAMFGYCAPWVWLVAISPHGQSASPARLLLAATAAWSPLLAYPMPGGQLYFGSLPVLLAAIVCAADLAAVAAEVPAASGGAERARRRPVAPAVAALALVIALAALYFQFRDSRQQYRQNTPVGLAGTQFMRLEPQLAQHYAQLVAAIAPADTVLTTFRFNSLYLWSNMAKAAPEFISQWQLPYASGPHQQAVKQRLDTAAHPLVVTRDRGASAAAPVSGIMRWVEETFEPARRIGPYTVWQRRDSENRE